MKRNPRVFQCYADWEACVRAEGYAHGDLVIMGDEVWKQLGGCGRWINLSAQNGEAKMIPHEAQVMMKAVNAATDTIAEEAWDFVKDAFRRDRTAHNNAPWNMPPPPNVLSNADYERERARSAALGRAMSVSLAVERDVYARMFEAPAGKVRR